MEIDLEERKIDWDVSGPLSDEDKSRTENLAVELSKRETEASVKLSYLVMAAAASGIALALDGTSTEPLRWPHLVLTMAVVSWAASVRAAYVSASTAWLAQSTAAATDLIWEGPDSADEELVYSARFWQADAEVTHTYYNTRQSAYFTIGALLYAVWHLVEMLINTL